MELVLILKLSLVSHFSLVDVDFKTFLRNFISIVLVYQIYESLITKNSKE
jgi:hypothetical protein